MKFEWQEHYQTLTNGYVLKGESLWVDERKTGFLVMPARGGGWRVYCQADDAPEDVLSGPCDSLEHGKSLAENMARRLLQ
jgi:hypothetical protein